MNTADVVGHRLARGALQGAARRKMGGGPENALPPPDAAEPKTKPPGAGELDALRQAALKSFLADDDKPPGSDTEVDPSAVLLEAPALPEVTTRPQEVSPASCAAYI